MLFDCCKGKQRQIADSSIFSLCSKGFRKVLEYPAFIKDTQTTEMILSMVDERLMDLGLDWPEVLDL